MKLVIPLPKEPMTMGVISMFLYGLIGFTLVWGLVCGGYEDGGCTEQERTGITLLFGLTSPIIFFGIYTIMKKYNKKNEEKL